MVAGQQRVDLGHPRSSSHAELAPAVVELPRVDLHVVTLGRRPELDLREVEPTRGAPADAAIPTTTESATNRGEIHEKYTS